jgi:hypothetical protein
MSSQMVSMTLTLVPKNSRKSRVSVNDKHPSQRDRLFIRPRAIPQKSGIAAKGPMWLSWSSSPMILWGLGTMLALFAMGRRRTRVEGEGRFFYERGGSFIVSYDMARVVFVCGVFLLLLA